MLSVILQEANMQWLYIVRKAPDTLLLHWTALLSTGSFGYLGTWSFA